MKIKSPQVEDECLGIPGNIVVYIQANIPLSEILLHLSTADGASCSLLRQGKDATIVKRD